MALDAALSRARACAFFVLITIALAACGGAAPGETDPTASEPSGASASPAESAAGSAAAGGEQPLEPGALEAGVRYVLDGPPRISLVPHEATSAFPAAEGALLTFGETKVFVATGVTDVYVGRGDQEPIGDAMSVMEAFARNERIAIDGTGTMQIAGAEAPYADFTLPFDANAEGGTPIVSIEASPLFLADLTANRVILLEGADGLAVIVISVPEDSDLQAAVESMAPLLESVTVD